MIVLNYFISYATGWNLFIYSTIRILLRLTLISLDFFMEGIRANDEIFSTYKCFWDCLHSPSATCVVLSKFLSSLCFDLGLELEQCPSNFSMNHLGNLLKCRFWLVGLGYSLIICISGKQPGHAGLTLWVAFWGSKLNIF